MDASGDEVFRQLVLAPIIEPVSKVDSLRVLEEAGLVRQRQFVIFDGTRVNDTATA